MSLKKQNWLKRYKPEQIWKKPIKGSNYVSRTIFFVGRISENCGDLLSYIINPLQLTLHNSQKSTNRTSTQQVASLFPHLSTQTPFIKIMASMFHRSSFMSTLLRRLWKTVNEKDKNSSQQLLFVHKIVCQGSST